MHVLHIDTTARETMTDITPRLEELVRAGNIRSGLLFVYTPHTTTALTINEETDPDVRRDILSHLRALVPENSWGSTRARGGEITFGVVWVGGGWCLSALIMFSVGVDPG